MAAKLDVVIQHALRTFATKIRKLPDCFQTEINELKSLTEELTAKDISGLRELSKTNELKDFLLLKKTALDYLSVYEDDNISVGVFLLKQGTKLPIHDHPSMYGIIKVLEGILKITSYSLIEIDESVLIENKSMFYNNPIKVVKHPTVIVGNKDNCCLLTPTERNIHEVECVEGPAAFLDILSPPYEDGGSEQPRVCHYFEEVSETKDSDLRLIQVPSPF